MPLKTLFQQRPFCLSIEIFPPKSPSSDDLLWENLSRLAPYQPAFISCTYGAGGSTRTRTVELCQEIQRRFQVPATAHFTCVGSTTPELEDWLDYAQAAGISNFMALRGDPPRGETTFRQVAGGLAHANELVSLIRRRLPEVGIGVAGYPEKHPEAADLPSDLAHLKRKIDAGADAVFTQLFFGNRSFFQFRDACDAAGIRVPIVPGIMPIVEFGRIRRITSMCGAIIPLELAANLEAAKDDLAAQLDIGVEFAIRQCQELIDAGVPGIHFYALNSSSACQRILDALNARPAEASA
ncbi:MAG: methylenetetrahydrofolate reductase [NAD(P)H] [Planctomyces sp.]|nr:methylenetetrahydrofolate reductase [NAD(P)H] [Planctomyces sp.]